MKIAIITFHASFNYGSMLQAWALQTYLQSLDHNAIIVNYRSKVQRGTYHKPIDFHNIANSLSSCKRLLTFPESIRPLLRKWHLFDDFLCQELHLTAEYHSLCDIRKQDWSSFDLLICGSDQIWNSGAQDSNETYFGNWFPNRKIAYAASFGPRPENVNWKFTAPLLKGFSALGLREERGMEKVLEYRPDLKGDLPMEIVCDPTLLLTASVYDKFVYDKPLIKGDYVFFYTAPFVGSEQFAVAAEIGKRLGCQVITDKAYYPNVLKPYGICQYLPTGPREFLNLIRHSKLVTGGSFHLLVFSLLLHKDFLCIDGDKDARTNNLLKITGLENRIVSLNAPHQFTLIPIENWSVVDKNIAEYSSFSREWLSKVIMQNDSKCDN